MKKVYFFALLLFPAILFAQSFLISNIPLPKTKVQNLDPFLCDEKCLQNHLENGFIFSFLAYYDSSVQNNELKNEREKYLSLFNIERRVKNNKLEIALLLPYKKIARYAASTTNASFAYLMAKNRPFELKTYQIEDETQKEISEALIKIKKDGFNYIIAPLTQDGEDVVSKIDPKINIYFPTINKKDSKSSSKYLYYGGIDYRAQSDLLLNESKSNLTIFYDNSSIGEQLSEYQERTFKHKNINQPSTVSKFSIPQRTTNLEKQLKENARINGGSFFINTPIIKSGMIISQLTLYDANATNILSTQTNYNPLLLSMTQYQDRKKMIIANSITQNKDVLIETNSLLGNDILYDWINYTTSVGIDYFSYLINGEKREYEIENINNQMMYPIKLIRPSVSRFIPFELTNEE